ncbi:MAG: YceI family protein [Pseudomonadota bacterium]
MAKRISLGSAVFALAAFAACTEPTDASSDTESAVIAEAAGPWTLSTDASALTYLSIKSGNVAEINTFGELSGTVSEEGSAEISINLNSVNTNVDIRNERMRNVFFETETYPTATARTTLDMDQFSALEVGNSVTVPVRFEIDLHGETASYDIDASVTRLGVNKVGVDNTAPLILYPEDFNLIDGLGQLQSLAGLDSITPIVPINVSFVFERTG